jgi:hypothetical protein
MNRSSEQYTQGRLRKYVAEMKRTRYTGEACVRSLPESVCDRHCDLRPAGPAYRKKRTGIQLRRQNMATSRAHDGRSRLCSAMWMWMWRKERGDEGHTSRVASERVLLYKRAGQEREKKTCGGDWGGLDWYEGSYPPGLPGLAAWPGARLRNHHRRATRRAAVPTRLNLESETAGNMYTQPMSAQYPVY